MKVRRCPFLVLPSRRAKTTPPKHFTEDTLLSAMETAGKDDMPEGRRTQGLENRPPRQVSLEKLVSTGFLERKKSKKTVQLMPSHDAGIPYHRAAGAAAIAPSDR